MADHSQGWENGEVVDVVEYDIASCVDDALGLIEVGDIQSQMRDEAFHIAAQTLGDILRYIWPDCRRRGPKSNPLRQALLRVVVVTYAIRPDLMPKGCSFVTLAKDLGITKAYLSKLLKELQSLAGIHIAKRTETACEHFAKAQRNRK